MVFKPFKPPLIRKPPQTDSNPDTADKGPPPKKQRLSEDADQLPAAQKERKPLLQLKNANDTEGSLDRDDDSVERYYNALWRKFTAKKHKTWDGDGILTVRGGQAHLQDVSGKHMGHVVCGSRIEAGSMLSIGGKDVEVDSEIPKEEYLSGRIFLEQPKNDSPPVVHRKEFVPVVPTRTPSGGAKPSTPKESEGKHNIPTLENPASKKTTAFGTYKKPLLETTVLPQAAASQPVPRHDPNAPGALVMKRLDSVAKGKQVVDVVIDPILTKHLRQHQREGVKFLYECAMGMKSFNGEGAILADDMGLGKTLQTITLLWTLLKQNPIYGNPPVVKKALIVCPVTLINNWRKEFRKWLGNERIGVFVYDDKRKRLTDFTKGKAYNIMVVGYEKLRTVQENLSRGAGVDIVIADEGHRLKTLQNKSGQAIQSLNASKRIILSGTPIQNDLREFFATVDLVNPGVLGTFKGFVKEFEGPIVRSRQPEATRKDIEKGEARNEELRELTSKFILRRTADILAKYLPPKTEYVLFCNSTSTQANIYRSVLASPVFQCAIGNSESALQLITILKKVCNSPSLLSSKNQDESASDTVTALLSSLPPNLLRHFSPSSSAKIRVLDQLLHNLRTATSEKIVLVSNYTSTLNLLATLLTSLSLPFLRLDGSTPAQKRQSLVEDFNRLPANACFAFLLSAKAGGTGLNLIGASRLVLFDVDWNPATDIQAMARIHRDGQKRPCRIYRILLKGSLEEKIWQRQVTKIGLADSVMEHKDTMSQFSRDELRDLFRLDEESTCQTHDLLGCDCGGRGQAHPEKLEHNSSSPAGSDTGIDDDDYDLPDVPTLIKASQLDMEEQERQIREDSASKKTAAKKNNKMHLSLAQYSHIDPSVLSIRAEEDSIQREINDDNVLFPLLKEEDNRVGFVFKKGGNGESAPAGRGGESATNSNYGYR